MAALPSEKAQRILDRMDRLVDDFVQIFNASTPEAASLVITYSDLNHRILAELEKEVSIHA